MGAACCIKYHIYKN